MKLTITHEADILFVGEINGVKTILVCVCEKRTRTYYRLVGNFRRTTVSSNSSVSDKCVITRCDWLKIEKADTFLDIDVLEYGTKVDIADTHFQLIRGNN